MRKVGEMTDTRVYRHLMEQLARRRMNQRVSNGISEHASILFETMFRHAKEEVRIFTGELRPSVYGTPTLISAAKDFLSRTSTRLRILIEQPADVEALREHPLLRVLSESVPRVERDQLKLRQAVGSYAQKGAKHFAVMDDCGFRFEIDHEATQAVANFNEPDVARELSVAFDSAFKMGLPLELH